MDTVRPYITKDEPFGPIDSTDIDSNDIDALRLLFEQQNRIYKNLRNRPSIIIGRRGSGKTYYLRSVFFDKAYKHRTCAGAYGQGGAKGHEGCILSGDGLRTLGDDPVGGRVRRSAKTFPAFLR